MKQYLLSLRSSDFTKSGNTWTTTAINLYNNSSYKNYSTLRSAYGLNLIGDRTYTGIEMASPSSSGDHATPIDPNAVYVTDQGEVIYETATPSLQRFIDTSSQIDLLAFSHKFVNISGSSEPTFSLTIYESDDSSGPWLESYSSGEISTLFMRDVNQYVKIELEIEDDEAEMDTAGLIFLLEVGIHDSIPPVVSRTGKNILRRFPSWTKIYEDSVDSATPSLDVPQSEGGKFLTALTQDSLNIFENIVDLDSLNSYINTADINQLAWIYASYSIPAAVVSSIYGDDIKLAPVSSLDKLLALRSTDYAFYYSAIDRTVYTTRKFDNLLINSVIRDQDAVSIFNSFDEMGAKVGLPRLYLEGNDNFKKRILDVSQNTTSGNIEGLKRTLRRELDIWRAYGATPDSDYLGATPEILEISDIERSTPYVDSYLRPSKAFKDLVKKINTIYPSNIGYVKWSEGVWDYSGFNSEGVSRLHSVYDQSSSPLSSYYQPGVGDFNDAKFEIVGSVTDVDQDSSVTDFSGYLEIEGTEVNSQNYSYDPIIIDYTVVASYIRDDVDLDSSGPVMVYEVDMPAHDNYSTPSTFYVNLDYNTYPGLYVKNRYSELSSASPEYSMFKVFDQDGLSLTGLPFKDKVYDEAYLNTDSTPNSQTFSLNEVDEVRVVFGQSWNQGTQAYVTETYGDFRASFSLATPNFYSSFSAGDFMSLATPDITSKNANVYVGSEYYGTTPNLYYTSKIVDKILLNDDNDLSSSSATPKRIDIQDIKDKIIYPASATPENIFLNISSNPIYPLYNSDSVATPLGGYSSFHGDQVKYLVPSSPNILYTVYDSSSSVTQSQDYFESATINYSSSDDHILVESDTGDFYPFEYDVESDFSATTSYTIFQGYIDEYGNAYESSEDPENTFYRGDKTLGDYSFDLSTFSMSSPNTYRVEKATFHSATPGVKLYVKDKTSFVQDLNSAFENYTSTTESVYADKEESYKISVHPGYIYFDEDDWYIYEVSNTQSENGRFFEIELDKIPNAAKPFIVNVDGEDWRHIVFEDSATPGSITFTNTESVEYIGNNTLMLAYTDVSNVEVVDSYTDRVVNNSVSESGGLIEPFDSATPGVYGRYYDVSYTVNNSFHVDPDVLVGDEYRSYLYLSSTPSSNVNYEITYETSFSDRYNYVDLEIDQYENPLSEGFVYVSNEEYDFNKVEHKMSPYYLYDNTEDFANFTITSYDVNHNLKPGQTFRVHGTNIAADPEYVTTNDNGLGFTKIYYSGSVPTSVSSGQFIVEGIGSATPNGGTNSSSEGYSSTVNFEVFSENYFNLQVKAVPVRMHIKADGTSDVIIIGQVYWMGYPIGLEVDIDWYVADYVADLFNGNVSATTVTSDENGRFVLENVITTKSKNDPGIRFARVDLNSSSSVVSDLQAQGETIASNDVTISGDIVYWNETFDNVEFFDDEAAIPRDLLVIPDENRLFANNPVFRYNHSNPEVITYSTSTQPWSTQRWVPMTRYQQYQLGYFGSTPNTITTYSNIHPDYGDS